MQRSHDGKISGEFTKEENTVCLAEAEFNSDAM